MDDSDRCGRPFELSGEFGEALIRASGRYGSWAAVNRVPLDGALWLVGGHDRDDSGSWTAAPFDEPVTATLANDELVIAGRADDAARIVVLIDGKAHPATPQADGIWLMLIDGIRGATKAAVRTLDQRGALIDETVVEVPGNTHPALHSMRSRLRRWLDRGMKRPPRGSTAYGRR